MTLRLVLLVGLAAMPAAAQAPVAPSPVAPRAAIESCQPQPECRLLFLRNREPATLKEGIELKGPAVAPERRVPDFVAPPAAVPGPSR